MLSMEAYIEFLIAGYLNLNEIIVTTIGETISVGLGFYSIILTLIVFPCIFVYVLTRPLS